MLSLEVLIESGIIFITRMKPDESWVGLINRHAVYSLMDRWVSARSRGVLFLDVFVVLINHDAARPEFHRYADMHSGWWFIHSGCALRLTFEFGTTIFVTLFRKSATSNCTKKHCNFLDYLEPT